MMAEFSPSADRPFLIAGPCVIESEDHTLKMADAIARIARAKTIDLVFKASYDKANRTSFDAYRGPGLEEGLRILARVRSVIGLPVLTDIHETREATPAAEVVDILQIPAFLCRQTDLIAAAVRTGRWVNIKKGQFLAPWDLAHAVEKARQAGGEKIMVTERGASFGYNNLVSDMRSLVELRKLGVPVLYDATHSVQMPGGAGSASSGRREYIEPLLRAAVAVGLDGVFIEVHDAPDRARSDGPNQLPLDRLSAVINSILAFDATRRGLDAP
jgi:2-dehydro-3-deoxyphosphooctonate aldolase (KDO 8-P synthase)